MNNPLKRVSTWRPDLDAYDPSARICVFALAGKVYTGHSIHADGPDDWPIVVRHNGTYVATVGNWERLPLELSGRLASLENAAAELNCR